MSNVLAILVICLYRRMYDSVSSLFFYNFFLFSLITKTRNALTFSTCYKINTIYAVNFVLGRAKWVCFSARVKTEPKHIQCMYCALYVRVCRRRRRRRR